MCQADPLSYLSQVTGLASLPRLVIQHKPIKCAAEFKVPNRIYLDFRQPVAYMALSVAHETAHLLLRRHRWSKQPGVNQVIRQYGQSSTKYHYTREGTIEQVLSILLQLSYENRFCIRKFSEVHARKLMKIMGVWPMGQPFLKRWPSFLKGREGLIVWLRKNLSES